MLFQTSRAILAFALCLGVTTAQLRCVRRRTLINSGLYCLNQPFIEVYDSEGTKYIIDHGSANQRITLPSSVRTIQWYCGTRTKRARWVLPSNTVDITYGPVTDRVSIEPYDCRGQAPTSPTQPTPTAPTPTTPTPTTPSATPPPVPVTSTPTPPAPVGPPCVLTSGNKLPRGSYLECGNERFGVSQTTGDVVYIKDGIVLWSAGVSGANELHMQASDGNLVAYTLPSTPVWATSNSGQLIPGSSLYVGGGGLPRVISPTGVVAWELSV